MVWGFACFDFAAGEFPITGVGFALGALGHQEGAIRLLQYGYCDFN
jgi:hypothetical protein